jgi:hypothetical protein
MDILAVRTTFRGRELDFQQLVALRLSCRALYKNTLENFAKAFYRKIRFARHDNLRATNCWKSKWLHIFEINSTGKTAMDILAEFCEGLLPKNPFRCDKRKSPRTGRTIQVKGSPRARSLDSMPTLLLVAFDLPAAF